MKALVTFSFMLNLALSPFKQSPAKSNPCIIHDLSMDVWPIHGAIFAVNAGDLCEALHWGRNTFEAENGAGCATSGSLHFTR